MALFDEKERNILIGVGIGVAVTVFAKEVFPILGSLGRPLLKAAVKSSLLLYDRGREAAAHFEETLEDLVAEARVELTGDEAVNSAASAVQAKPDEKVN